MTADPYPLPITEDQAARAQRAGELAYRELLEQTYDGDSDGCEVCVVREVLLAAAPILLEGIPRHA